MAGMPPLPPGTDLWKVPAGKAPPGYPDSDLGPGAATNQNIAVITLSLFIVIATLFLALRLYARFFVVSHKPWWDDLVLVIALPPQIAYTTIVIWMVKSGYFSRHIWDTPLAVPLLKLPYWTIVLAVLPQPITFLVKLALLLLFYRIFAPNPRIRYAIWFGIVIDFMMYTVWFFVFIYNDVFQETVGSRLSMAQAAFNVASDLYLVMIPLVGVANLHVSRKRKFGIMGIFFTGFAACAMSVVTLYYRVHDASATNPDPTWHATAVVTVSCLEVDIGMMCACMPLFAPFFPKKAKLSIWTSYIRSFRTRLLRTTQASRDTEQAASNAYGGPSDSSLVNKNGAYVELGERKSSAAPSAGSVRGSERAGTGRKEWFDRETVMGNSLMGQSNVDRNSVGPIV